MDTREKMLNDLELLTKKWRDYDGNYMKIYGSVAYAQIKELLDRQKEITERECADKYVNTWTAGSVAWILRQYEDEKLMRDVDYEAKVALETEELQEHVDTLEAENRLMRERLRSIADNDVTVFGMKLAEVRNLQAENAKLREELSVLADKRGGLNDR